MKKWITGVLNQVSKIKTWLKTWKYLDEALDFAKKANCPIDEAEIIRCNSTGLAIFQSTKLCWLSWKHEE